jgi:hypothetical protein
MSYEELLSEKLESDDEGVPLTDSGKTYLEFRKEVEPRFFDTGFDLLPAKSEPFGYTDQTLRSHVLNGAAFAARLNHGLKQLDQNASLDTDSLREAIALFAVHDLHKTPSAQHRRNEATERVDADKDLTSEEVAQYVSQLELSSFAPELTEADFRAAALGTESQSGRHRGATSRKYVTYRPWLRLMDAAASMDDPSEATSLHSRLHEISGDVNFTHHTLSDAKGVTTNFLTSAVSSFVESETDAVSLVYFSDGAIYLTPSDTDPETHLNGRKQLSEELTDTFIDTIRENVSSVSSIEDTRQTLVDKLNYGFMEFSRPTYLLYGFDRADEALRQDLAERMAGEPTLYSQYELAATAAYGGDAISKLPSDWRTGQAATVYISTLYKELFNPLEDEDTISAIETVAAALGVSDTASWLSDLDDLGWSDDLSGDATDELASHMPTTTQEVTEHAEGTDLTYVNRFIGVIALAYIEDGADGSLGDLSSEGVLERLSERLIHCFEEWNDDWDANLGREWDAEQPTDEKAESFLTRKISTVREATHQYITDTVTLFGQSLGTGPSSKSKLDEYASQYQPHICLLCNTVLTGSRSKSDFETSQDTIGMSMRFSHLAEISAEGGEPDALACPMCELEMVIRNSVHDFRDEESKYLFVAPDYFYAPADVSFEKTVRNYLVASDGYNIFQLAQRLLASKPAERSDAVAEILDALGPDDSPAYQNSVKNYDGEFNDFGSLGVFRLDPPRRDVGSESYVTRIPRETLNYALAVVFSWLTSSRTLLTSRPVPIERFDEFDEMVQIVDLPAELRATFGETVSISNLRDLDTSVESNDMTLLSTTEDSQPTGAETVDTAGDDAATEDQAADPSTDPNETSVSTYQLTPETQFEDRLYQLAGLLTVTFRQHGTEVQRLKSVLSAMSEPFPAATVLLKGDERHADYDALNAANVLDTLTHRTMSNSIQSLAEAGFKAVRPELDKESNYNFERLFRVAREAVSDNVMQNTSKSELETIVAGEVMKAAARAETSDQFAEEEVKREAAEKFGDIFVNDILYGICDGDFYELRRNENSLAAGYNAAIRRVQQESFADND